MTNGAPVSTGSSAIDELLGGGLERSAITQVYGPPAAGKSTLAMSSAVAVAACGSTAIYIDTEGLSHDRLDQLTAASVQADAVADTLDRILVTTATDFDEQAQQIRDTAQYADGASLIVLDSATALYRLERADEGDDGDSLDRLANQVAFLLSLARRYNTAVLLTNQVFTDPDAETIRPLGGAMLEHWSSTILRLDRFRGSRRRLSAEKLTGESSTRATMLQLTDGGFKGIDL